MNVEQIKQVLVGAWASIAPEIRPSAAKEPADSIGTQIRTTRRAIRLTATAAWLSSAKSRGYAAADDIRHREKDVPACVPTTAQESAGVAIGLRGATPRGISR
jgi:hypothetical protein